MGNLTEEAMGDGQCGIDAMGTSMPLGVDVVRIDVARVDVAVARIDIADVDVARVDIADVDVAPSTWPLGVDVAG